MAVDDVMRSFGIERFRRHRIAELSTGTRRVVDLASIVLARPRLLLLDEPTAGIAQREAEAFVPLLRRLHEVADTTILLVEHDVPLVFALCDKVVMMESGSVVSAGTPDEVGATRGRWPRTSGRARRRWRCPAASRPGRARPAHPTATASAGPGRRGSSRSARRLGRPVGHVAPEGDPVPDPGRVAVVVERVVQGGPVVPEGHRPGTPAEPAGELRLLAVPVEHVEDAQPLSFGDSPKIIWVNCGLTKRPLRPFSGWVRTTGWMAGSSFSCHSPCHS